MKIKTTIPVTYNNGIASQENGLVIGILQGCNQILKLGFDTNYTIEYISDNGQIIANKIYSMNIDEINELYDMVKNEVPVDLNYTDTTIYLYYLGFRVKMAQTFNILTSDIEIIVD